VKIDSDDTTALIMAARLIAFALGGPALLGLVARIFGATSGLF
tara:strand:+ start:1886 stop:2014 length:129 start_codon:yes stop_codon:yes gene_type:complete